MKNPIARGPVILAAFILALFLRPASAQIKTAGEVVEVIDARTAIVAVPAGRVTVELQYIDVPEPTQALHSTIKEHVRAMILGKGVELHAQGFTRSKTHGRLILNGIDVGQQLLRDGAAWHIPIEISGQSRAEFDSYAESEALARQEKRGVWSVAGIKAPWQVRAENEETQRRIAAAARHGKPTSVGVSAFRTDTRLTAGKASVSAPASRRLQMDAWVSVFAHGRREAYGIQVYNDPKGVYSVVYTSPVMIEFSSPAGKETLECRAMYVTSGRESFYFIGFRAIADEYRFSKGRTRMTALVDSKAIAFGAPFGKRGKGLIGAGAIGSQEIMLYWTTWATVRKLANAQRVEFRIDKLAGSLPAEGRELFKQLVAAIN